MGQNGKDVAIYYKVESVFNTAPGASGSKQLRSVPGAGLSLKRVAIQSNEVRSDRMSSMGRLGSFSVDGSYSGELSLSAFDELLEAIFCSSFAAAVTITVDNSAEKTSFTVTDTNTVTFQGTDSLITLGLRVGDVVRFTNMSTAGNNSINLPVISVGANTFDVAGAPLTVQGADTAATLTILKKLKMGSTRRSFYFEQYQSTNDVSQVFGGCRIVSLSLNGQADGMCMAEFGIVGASSDALASGSSPYYSAPTTYTNIPLVWTDALILVDGVAIATLTSFQVSFQRGGATLPVIGSNTSPDVYEGNMTVSGSFSGARVDLANVTKLKNETEFSFFSLLVEPESEPKDCMSLFLPRLKVTTAEGPYGNDGAMIETVNFMCGKKESVTGFDDTMATISSSAA